MAESKDIADILLSMNANGKYNKIIHRAAANGYHDYKFDENEEFAYCICPKIDLLNDLAEFPELFELRQRVINGDFDEEADAADIENMKKFWLL